MLVANNAGRNDDGGGKTKLLPRPVNRLNRLGAAQLVDCKWVAIHTVEKQAGNTGLYPDCLFRQLWRGYTHLTEVKPGISLNASASASAPLPPMALFAKLPAVSLSGEQQI